MASLTGSDDLRVVFERLLAAVLDTADDTAVASVLADVQRARSWLEAVEVRCVARNRTLHPEPTDRGGRDRDRSLLTHHGRHSGRDARAAADRANACERIPELGNALDSGAVTAGHLDALNRATAGASDDVKGQLASQGDKLADAAANETVDAFERTVRGLIRDASDDDGVARLEQQRAQRRCTRSIDRETGMSRTSLWLDPVTGDAVWTAIDAAIRSAHAQRQTDDPRTWNQFVADVVVGQLTGTHTKAVSGAPEICALVDLATLVDGPHPGTICETSGGTDLPYETLRRLLCDADILPIVLNGDSVPVDIGRAVRTATREQRSALRAMYRTCAFAGCSTRFDECHVHHVQFWSAAGPTNLANLIPLCQHHHHLVHEGGWTLTITPTRAITITTADGRLHFHGDTRNATPRPGRGPRCAPRAEAADPAPPAPAQPPDDSPPDWDATFDAILVNHFRAARDLAKRTAEQAARRAAERKHADTG